MTRATLLLATSLTASLVGCAGWHAENADAEVADILAAGRAQEAELRSIQHPRPAEIAAVDSRFLGPETQRLTLAEALAIAVKNNRGYRSQKETLYQEGLALTQTRFDFGPRLSSTLSYIWSDDEFGVGVQSASAGGTVSQILPTGGTASLSGSLSASYPEGRTDQSFGTSVSLDLDQPLLRGAGRAVSHERLTQAERTLVYALRTFELFRQDFSIDLAQSYYDLVSQQQTLNNQVRTYDEAVYDRKKAEALRQVDRNSDEQVFRARRREVVTQNGLINARARYKRALDEFKIQLGLPSASNLDVSSLEPLYETVDFDPVSAVEAALRNRLDVATSRQQMEDAERRAFLAENGLLPQLDLSVNGSFSGSDQRLQKAWADEWGFSGGLSLQLPLQLKRERNLYRNSLIRRDRARRTYDLFRDRVGLEVRDQLRQLDSVEEQIVIQEAQIIQERRAVTVTEIRYEAGLLDNRDLLEARQGLIDAQNSLIRLKVDHFIRRLRLLRSLGLLEIDTQGRWK
ncbi:MAG: TolC family protein [Planctomycetes bacterium]|nr:TolC family protein [Planctomycetota bacterium]